MFQPPYIACILFLTVITGFAQSSDTILAEILVQPQENNLVAITGVGINNSLQTEQLHYTLIIQKKSRTGNTSNNEQRGTFILGPHYKKTLSTTTINFESRDQTEITLTLFNSKHVQIAQQQRLLSAEDSIKN